VRQSKSEYKISEKFKNLIYAFFRFPVTILYLTVFVILMCVRENVQGNGLQVVKALSMTCVVGALLNMLSVAVKERFCPKRYHSTITFVGLFMPFLLFLSLYLFSLNDLWLFRSYAFGLIFFLGFMLVPCIKSQENTFDKMAIIIIRHLYSSFFSTLMIYLGAYVVLYGVNSLFIISSFEKINVYILYICIYIFALSFLSKLPKYSNQNEIEAFEMSENIKKIVSYIVIPVIFIFSAIFAGYFVKIFVTGIWPSNQIVKAAVVYSIAGICVYMIAGNISSEICKLFKKIFPIICIVFNIMSAIAVLKRISVYAITYNRYFAMLIIAFSVVCCLVYLIKSKIYLVATVSLFCFFVAFSCLPIVNFFDVSCYSQMLRAEKILQRNYMLESGVLKSDVEIPSYDMQELYNSVEYLTLKDKTKIAYWLPDGFVMSDFERCFGYSENSQIEDNDFYYRNYILKPANYNVSGYDLCINAQTEYLETGVVSSAEFKGNRGEYYYELISDNSNGSLSLVLKRNGAQIMQSDFNEMISYFKNEAIKDIKDSAVNVTEIPLPLEKMSCVLYGGGSRLYVVFTAVTDNRSMDIDYKYLDSLTVVANVYLDEYYNGR